MRAREQRERGRTMEELKNTIWDLPTPAVTVDLDIAERNVKKMAQEAAQHGLAHRPHIKTHRSGYFAQMQIKAGCTGITAAKLGEAEVMADDGITDIFIAYPIIGEDKLERLVKLHRRVKVSTIVNSVEGARSLSRAFDAAGRTIQVLIEIDGGLNRGGVKPEAALKFAEAIRDLPGIAIVGLMYYGGLIYNSHNIAEVEEYTRRERDCLVQTASQLRDHGFCMDVLSAGSSYSGKCPELLEGITEIRSGHYIFNDCGQLDIHLAEPEDCALTVITTVVSKPDTHVVICDVGTKSLTSDACHYRKGYGYVIGHPDMEIYALNEEHAFLRCEGENPLQIGDKVQIIPNHACVVTNLADRVYGTRNGVFERVIAVDAKGKSV